MSFLRSDMLLTSFEIQCVCVCVCVFSHVQLFATPWTVACQAFLSMEFSRQEYWSENQWAFNRCWLIKSLQKWTCWDSILRGGGYLIGNNVFNIRPPWAIKKNNNNTTHNRNFCGGPVVENLPSNAEDVGSIPGQETKIPRAVVVQSVSLCPTLCNPMDLRHARLSCPSLSPRVCSNSCSLSRWCHPDISSSVTPFFYPQSFQHQGLLQWVSSSHQVTKVLDLQLQHQSLQGIYRVDFL